MNKADLEKRIEELREYFVAVYKDTLVKDGNITEDVVSEMFSSLIPKLSTLLAEVVEQKERKAFEAGFGESAEGFNGEYMHPHVKYEKVMEEMFSKYLSHQLTKTVRRGSNGK